MIRFLPRRASRGCPDRRDLAAPLLRVVYPGFAAFVVTPWRSDSLLSGALLALAVRSPAILDAVKRSPEVVWALFVALLVGAAVMTRQPSEFGAFNHFWLAGLYSVFVLIAFAYDTSRITSVLKTGVLVWLGRRSYAIYLFHQAANGLPRRHPAARRSSSPRS